jgi:glutaredoxin
MIVIGFRMLPRMGLLLAVFIALSPVAFSAIGIEFYYGNGCPHCAATATLLESMEGEYGLLIAGHEVYYDAEARAQLISQYERFGFDINQGGVPTSIVNGRTMVIGGLSETQWRWLFKACLDGACPEGAFTQASLVLPAGNQSARPNATAATENKTLPAQDAKIEPLEELNGMGGLTITVLIGAALVDSVNPCTIAVMVLLCGAIICSRGKRSALAAGLIFSSVIFIMYMLYGLGIMKAITAFELARAFYGIVTAGALALAAMELNAYFNYKPGFLAVEMPMALRPYAKKVTAGATSPAGVAFAAMLCSVLLLPCSSGPYLLVLGMLAKAATVQTVGYLALYNLFFILPMLVITTALYLGKTSVEKVNAMKEEHIKAIHLVSGLILLALFVMMLGQATGWY